MERGLVYEMNVVSDIFPERYTWRWIYALGHLGSVSFSLLVHISIRVSFQTLCQYQTYNFGS